MILLMQYHNDQYNLVPIVFQGAFPFINHSFIFIFFPRPPPPFILFLHSLELFLNPFFSFILQLRERWHTYRLNLNNEWNCSDKFPGTCTSDLMTKCSISFGACVLFLVCIFQLSMEFFASISNWRMAFILSS